jgi:predicted nucleic acid-binding protein
VDAFDADVVIFAASRQHELGRRVRALLVASAEGHPDRIGGVGSALLLPEVLTKALREGRSDELDELAWVLGHLDLRPIDLATAEMAVALGAAYGMRAAHATHLATAVVAGADKFITNNRRDFPTSIREVEVVYPDALPVP